MRKNRNYKTMALLTFVAFAMMAVGCGAPPDQERKGVLFGPYSCTCGQEQIVYTATLPRRVDFNGTDNCEGQDAVFTWPNGGSYTVKDGQSSGSTTSLNTGEALKFKCSGTQGSCSYSYSLN